MDPTLHVYTYKDGLLARLAHDLRLTVGRFAVDLRDGHVRATFDPASARVDGVAHGERIDAAGLSDADKRTIARTVSDDILGAEPVELVGTVTGTRVRGRVTMRGRSAEVDFPVGVGPAVVVDAAIVPSRWGIPPYRALAGAIRLQDRWRVRLALPWEGGDVGAAERTWRVG